jgi:hypothetical protein
LLGYSYFAVDARAPDKVEKSSKKRKNQNKEVLPASDLLRVTGGVVLALVIVFPYWSSAVNFQSAIESQTIEKIEQAAIQRPFDAVRMIGSARVLSDNGNVEQARTILNLTVTAFPDSYAAWEALSKLAQTPDARMKEIKEELLRLDPRAPVTP